MTRYMRRLADRDLALDRAMIPLGSCTMIPLGQKARKADPKFDGREAKTRRLKPERCIACVDRGCARTSRQIRHPSSKLLP
jgi:hypothetical protein